MFGVQCSVQFGVMSHHWVKHIGQWGHSPLVSITLRKPYRGFTRLTGVLLKVAGKRDVYKNVCDALGFFEGACRLIHKVSLSCHIFITVTSLVFISFKLNLSTALDPNDVFFMYPVTDWHRNNIYTKTSLLSPSYSDAHAQFQLRKQPHK